MIEYLTIKTKTEGWGDALKSTDITGLIVALPPITYPEMRVQIEEIDGRDGDIVTDLGYRAYDLPVTVGLYGKYNVDDVMSFFKRKGQVIFSHQPDRYYDYEIIDSIALQRVIRFRKGIVNFHVQPFKHSAVEQAVTRTYAANKSGSFEIFNTGNIEARPIITITGNGTINLSLNDELALVLELTNETIVIDTERLEAYNGTVLKNRKVTGDYTNMALPMGTSIISWNRGISQMSVSNYSRWI